MQTRIRAAHEGRALDLLGNLLLEKASSEDFHGHAAAFVLTIEPAGGPPAHVHHGSDEFFYLLEGELDVWIGGRYTKLTPGMSAVLPRGTVHRFDNLTSTPAKALVVVTPGEGARFFDALDRERPQFPGDEARVAQILAEHDIFVAA